MIDAIIAADSAAFVFVNRTLANPVTDLIMPIVTNDNLLRILYGLLLVTLLIIGRRRVFLIVGLSILVVILTDQGSSALLKPLISRSRPCHLWEVHLLVNCGGGYSFPSSHAANLFGQALFFGLWRKKYLPYFLGFAFLVGISRIFVGVHFPLDVLGGMALGAVIGAVTYQLGMKLTARTTNQEKR